MKLNQWLFLFLFLPFLLSCEIKWPENPVGVLYYDDIEYREYAGSFTPYGPLYVHYRKKGQQEGSYVVYYMGILNSFEDEWLVLDFSTSISESCFSCRNSFSSDDIDRSTSKADFELERYMEFRYETTSWNISIEDLTFVEDYYDYDDINYERYHALYSCRIEFEAMVLDSLGQSHRISGWAKPSGYRSKRRY